MHETLFYAYNLLFSINQNQTTMKTKSLFLLFIVIISSCSKSINYTPEYKAQTAGRYLFSQDEVIDVYYKDNTLFLKWRGADKIKPIVLDDNKFSVIEMNKMIHFVEHPETKKRYLSKISETDETAISYDYVKVEDSFKVPSMYLKEKEYNKALLGYLEIQKKDSTSVFLNERSFNRYGYKLLRDKKYEDAIGVFKINVALYPESDNVYDSLAEAYLGSGDSLQAYNNYKKALEYNNSNRRAKRYVEEYNKIKKDTL